jgi:hypothetical protein
MKRVIHGKEFIDALLAAGVVDIEDKVSRVIIDARVDNVVVVYVERYGDERLYHLLPALSRVEIKETEIEP